jgi:ribosomal protein L33
MSETVIYFQEQLLQDCWENIFPTNDVKSTLRKFLSIFLIKFEASFPYIYLSNNRDKGWITQGIRKSCQRKRSLYIISKNSGNLMINLHYKKYCSILKKLIREAKKRAYFKQLIETIQIN